MTVARILAEKGRDVFTTQPHRTLREVIEMLAAKGVGAVVIADASMSVLGILSERDVVRVIAQNGAAALDDQVSRHMTPKVTTVTRDATIDQLMATMTEGRFRHLPVVEDGKLIGIVSIGDVVKRHVSAIDRERQALREYIATA
jgi:CBS domain-containing protein